MASDFDEWENEHGNVLPPPVLAPCTVLIGVPLKLRARTYPEISFLEERVLGPIVAASPALPSRLLMIDPDTGRVSKECVSSSFFSVRD